jgi:nicotinamidase-related amidase
MPPGNEVFLDLSPQRIAVLLVDFQNDFCSPDVFVGRPVTNTNNAAAAHRADAFAHRAAAAGATIVYTQQVLDLDRLTPRQRRAEEQGGICRKGTWGAELFLEPVPGSAIVIKDRFDCWQSPELTDVLERHHIDGLVICGVELVCCVLYAVLGADERGYQYLVPSDLVSGQDPGDDTDNRAVRDLLRFNQPNHVIDSGTTILQAWNA